MTKGNDATGRPKGHCYDTPSTWGHDVPLHAILLKVTTGGVKWYNWLGHRWGSNPGRLKIKFDVNAVSGWNGDREASLVRDMVHDIGHVLGVMHEHQRPDADTFIELFHDNVNYFDQFDDIIDKLNDQWTLPIQGKLDSSTARWDWSICKSIEGIFMNDPDQNVPQLADLLPVRDSAIWPWKSEFVRDTQTLGPFDWDSIMLYGSWSNQKNEDAITMRKRSDGSTFEQAMVPSAGDIAAVKRLYPDTPQVWDIPPVEPTTSMNRKNTICSTTTKSPRPKSSSDHFQ